MLRDLKIYKLIYRIETYIQRRIQNSVKHLRWNFLKKTVNSWKPFTIFLKSSILCVWLGSAYASGIIVLFKCSNFHSKLFPFDTQCMFVSPLNSHISEDFNFEDFQRHASHALRPIWTYRPTKLFCLFEIIKYYKIIKIIKIIK